MLRGATPPTLDALTLTLARIDLYVQPVSDRGWEG
jgi:hypothetical protein